MRPTLTFVLLLMISVSVSAQWQVVKVPKVSEQKPSSGKSIRHTAARVLDTIYRTPLLLPFWDDFSVQKNGDFPDTTKWVYSNSLIWNYGIGIHPPSIGVVSFNGLDSLGAPYDKTNPLAKGFGDKLISWPVDLTLVPADQLDSVYLSFFYQYQGNGEPPDNGDYLLVEFRTDTSSWIPVSQILVDTVEDAAVFKSINIKVAGTHYFHDQFQFRIRSFGRISGPWDTWNVDYVYLNKFRYATDITAPKFKDTTFPDRTIVSLPGSIFGEYWSIPASHFHVSADTTLIDTASFVVTNLRNSTQKQTTSFKPYYFIEEWTDGVPSSNDVTFPDRVSIPSLAYKEFRTVPVTDRLKKSDFTTTSDSIRVTVAIGFNSNDMRNDPDGQLDYLPKFFPLNFKMNDSVTTTQTLASYYAYDDGTAEFAAGLNQPGTEMAYLFNMKNDTVDNLIGADLYFPNVGDQSNQTIILTVRSDTSETGTLYADTLIIQRSAFDRFIHHKFYRNIHVSQKFYIGWVQTSSVLVAVGLDASHDTAEKIYYNVGTQWQSHPDLYGSLMIRPRFGGQVVTGIEDDAVVFDVYPNPNTGSFFLSAEPDAYEVVDFLGRRVDAVKEKSGDRVKVSLANPAAGLYLLKARLGKRNVIRRVMVQPSAQ